jgi:hypothetical protein
MGVDEIFGALREILRQPAPVVTQQGVVSFFRNPIADKFPEELTLDSSGSDQSEVAEDSDWQTEESHSDESTT